MTFPTIVILEHENTKAPLVELILIHQIGMIVPITGLTIKPSSAEIQLQLQVVRLEIVIQHQIMTRMVEEAFSSTINVALQFTKRFSMDATVALDVEPPS